MVYEDTKPQNSLSEAENRLKAHKTDIHHTSSSLLIFQECLNTLQSVPSVHRPVQMSAGCQKTVYKKHTLQVEGYPDSAATSFWCYLSFGSFTHMVDLAKSSHICTTVQKVIELHTCNL